MKRSKLFRKKLLPLFLSVAVAGSQVPVMAAEFGDAAVDFNPFPRAFIDLVERPLAVHRKKRFVVVDAF